MQPALPAREAAVLDVLDLVRARARAGVGVGVGVGAGFGFWVWVWVSVSVRVAVRVILTFLGAAAEALGRVIACLVRLSDA